MDTFDSRQSATVNDTCDDTPWFSGKSETPMQVVFLPVGRNGWTLRVVCPFKQRCNWCSKERSIAA